LKDHLSPGHLADFPDIIPVALMQMIPDVVPLAVVPPRKKKSTYADMAVEARIAMKEVTGSSVWAIEKYIQAQYTEITYRRVYLTNALKKCLENGRLKKHHQHSSSYVLGQVLVKPRAPRKRRVPAGLLNPLNLRPGTVIQGRYQIIATCGKGSFGFVMHCRDILEGRDVAIKVSRQTPGKSRAELSAAVAEFNLLRDIEAWEDAGLNSPPSISRCVRALQVFQADGLVCLVLEKLGSSVVSYLRSTQFVSLPLPLVRAIGRQLIEALRFLHTVGVAHLDVKPHNILFTSDSFTAPTPVLCADGVTRVLPLPADDSVKLIDFGGSRYVDDQESGYSYTTEFRSPEVVLDLDFSLASDMWSVGCVLLQLYTGQLLFRKQTDVKMGDLEHLNQMEVVLGPIPPQLALDAQASPSTVAKNCFDTNGRLRNYCLPSLPHDGQRPPLVPLHQRVSPEHGSFLNLLQQLLQYDPARRITAAAALAHPFFAEASTGSGCQQFFGVQQMLKATSVMEYSQQFQHQLQPVPVMVSPVLVNTNFSGVTHVQNQEPAQNQNMHWQQQLVPSPGHSMFDTYLVPSTSGCGVGHLGCAPEQLGAEIFDAFVSIDQQQEVEALNTPACEQALDNSIRHFPSAFNSFAPINVVDLVSDDEVNSLLMSQCAM
jgi:dual-specificity kinase